MISFSGMNIHYLYRFPSPPPPPIKKTSLFVFTCVVNGIQVIIGATRRRTSTPFQVLQKKRIAMYRHGLILLT